MQDSDEEPQIVQAVAVQASAMVQISQVQAPDMERGVGPGGQYLCVRPATVRGAASLDSAVLQRVLPGATVAVSGELQLDGHRRARLESKAEAEWVSLSTNTKALFEPLEGAPLLVVCSSRG